MKSDEYYMNLALEEAREAFKEDEVPVGAVLVIDGTVIAKSHNHKEMKKDVSSHAEIECLREASKDLGSYILENATLYVTLEPCLMCSGAIKDSRLKRLVIGALDKDKGAIISNYHVFDDPKNGIPPLITQGILKDDCSLILKDFFTSKR